MLNKIGFSTGAIAKGDFMHAVQLLPKIVRTVELSALREDELDPLLTWFKLNELALRTRFDHISIHAPSKLTFRMSDSDNYETEIVGKLLAFDCPVVVHPDVIRNHRVWRKMGPVLTLENMDKRKEIGHDYWQMVDLFRYLPEANLCVDLGHSRQVDPSMIDAKTLLAREGMRQRLRQIHISDVNAKSEHLNMDSMSVIQDFQKVTFLIPDDIPVIIESPCHDLTAINTELNAMHLLFPSRMEEIIRLARTPQV